MSPDSRFCNIFIKDLWGKSICNRGSNVYKERCQYVFLNMLCGNFLKILTINKLSRLLFWAYYSFPLVVSSLWSWYLHNLLHYLRKTNISGMRPSTWFFLLPTWLVLYWFPAIDRSHFVVSMHHDFYYSSAPQWNLIGNITLQFICVLHNQAAAAMWLNLNYLHWHVVFFSHDHFFVTWRWMCANACGACVLEKKVALAIQLWFVEFYRYIHYKSLRDEEKPRSLWIGETKLAPLE